jgi:hypothetical protein
MPRRQQPEAWVGGVALTLAGKSVLFGNTVFLQERRSKCRNSCAMRTI